MILGNRAASASPVMVDIHGLSKSFDDKQILHEIDLTVHRGEVVTVVGPSGSGKSTLLRCINYLERADEGYIRIDGKPIGYKLLKHRNSDHEVFREVGRRELDRQRSDVGMVFQSFNLFPHLTVLQNIVLAPRKERGLNASAAKDIARHLLERVGLPHKADAYPRQLSGGEQQRVAIARALALSPKVMLFDEPTSALDPELVGEVLDVIHELAVEGMTMIVVTHEWGFARDLADTVAFMDSGKLVEVSPPSQFFTHPCTPRAAEYLEKAMR